MKEMVLYYTPKAFSHVPKLKGVLVGMGIRIKNVDSDQIMQKVGYLAGMPGFEARPALEQKESEAFPVIQEEILVLKNFTSGRLDELLMRLRKAGVPRIALKAVVTEQNSRWTFYQLYEELQREHQAMSGGQPDTKEYP